MAPHSTSIANGNNCRPWWTRLYFVDLFFFRIGVYLSLPREINKFVWEEEKLFFRTALEHKQLAHTLFRVFLFLRGGDHGLGEWIFLWFSISIIQSSLILISLLRFMLITSPWLEQTHHWLSRDYIENYPNKNSRERTEGNVEFQESILSSLCFRGAKRHSIHVRRDLEKKLNWICRPPSDASMLGRMCTLGFHTATDVNRNAGSAHVRCSMLHCSTGRNLEKVRWASIGGLDEFEALCDINNPPTCWRFTRRTSPTSSRSDLRSKNVQHFCWFSAAPRKAPHNNVWPGAVSQMTIYLPSSSGHPINNFHKQPSEANMKVPCKHFRN